MIQPYDISVIVQGPIMGGAERLTGRAIESVRRVLPGAEIILSTWHGSDTGALACDALVLSDDPGATNWLRRGDAAALDKKLNNGNRQIVSTRAGLARATRP